MATATITAGEGDYDKPHPPFYKHLSAPFPDISDHASMQFLRPFAGFQSFMIYFITLQGSFPQKNGVLIKILLHVRNNGRIIEINSARKA